MNARANGRQKPQAADAISLGSLENRSAFFLRAAFDASAEAFRRRAAHFDIGPGEFATLTIVAANPGITQAQVSATTGRHMSTLTPILRRLGLKRWIERKPIPSDRRSFALSLTKLGAERLAEITLLADEHERELDRIIGASRKAEFVRILRRIRTLMP